MIQNKNLLFAVLRDLTCVLLDPKLLDQFMLMDRSGEDRQLLTPQQCRILLSDIACCSLMRLDITSMDKLWDLMIMVLKWQLSLIAETDPQNLLDLTFRHMDGIGRLLPEMRKTLLIDCTKRHLIEYWDTMTNDDHNGIRKSLLDWVQPYNVKISILIRLGFQKSDGLFEQNKESEFFQYYAMHVGENIYTKHAYMTSMKSSVGHAASSSRSNNGLDRDAVAYAEQTHEIDSLVSQLNIRQVSGRRSGTPVTTEPQTKQNNTTEDYTKDDGFGSEFKINGLLDEMSFVFDDTKEEDERGTYVPRAPINRAEDFVDINTVSTIDTILESFSLDFVKPRGDAGIVEDFDATRELLKLLDES